jgi:hypothetical protein
MITITDYENNRSVIETTKIDRYSDDVSVSLPEGAW